MTDSSDFDAFFPPSLFSRAQSMLHFIIFTQQNFIAPPPWARYFARSGNTMNKMDLDLALLVHTCWTPGFLTGLFTAVSPAFTVLGTQEALSIRSGNMSL